MTPVEGQRCCNTICIFIGLTFKGFFFHCGIVHGLSHPYCAIPQDYLRDISISHDVGLWVCQCEEYCTQSLHTIDVGCPPCKMGSLSDTCAIPPENNENGCDTILLYYLEKLFCNMGGILNWAEKFMARMSH